MKACNISLCVSWMYNIWVVDHLNWFTEKKWPFSQYSNFLTSTCRDIRSFAVLKSQTSWTSKLSNTSYEPCGCWLGLDVFIHSLLAKVNVIVSSAGHISAKEGLIHSLFFPLTDSNLYYQYQIFNIRWWVE